MKLKNKLLILIAIFAIAAGVYIFKPSNSEIAASPTPQAQSQEFSITQTINFGDGKVEIQDVDVSQDENVLEILKRTKDVETKTYDFGTLVESVEGVVNGTDDKYWTYMVNGEDANIGASEHSVNPGDAIEWKFSAYEE